MAREGYEIGDLLLDVGTVSVTRSGQTIDLPALSFDLLVWLARKAPAVISRQDLLDLVWPDIVVGEETLKQRVRLLRRALGDDSRQPRYIGAVRGKGYKLLPRVVPLQLDQPPDDDPSPLLRHQARHQSAPATLLLGPRRLPLKRAAIFIVAVSIILFGVLRDRDSSGAAENHQQSPIAFDAEDLYRRAEVYYLRYRAEDNLHAIQLLENAIALAPDFSPAHALLSRALSQCPKLGLGYWPERSLLAAQRSIALDPDDPRGYLALGLHYDISDRLSLGLETYRQVLLLDPENGTAHANSACSLYYLGRLDEALALNLKSLSLNKDIHFGHVQTAQTLALLGFDAEAMKWFHKMDTLQPDHLARDAARVDFYLVRGRWEEADQLITEALKREPESPQWRLRAAESSYFQGRFVQARKILSGEASSLGAQSRYRLALVLTALGESGVAQELLVGVEADLRNWIEEGKESPILRINLAGIATAQQRFPQALDWLEAAMEAGWRDHRYLALDPAFAALRDEPRYLAVVEGMQTSIANMRTRVLELGLLD